MKDTDLFETNSLFEDDECQCAEQCTCGKASDVFKEYAAEYFLPTTKFPVYSSKTSSNDDDDLIDFEDFFGDTEFIDEDDSEDEVLLITSQQIEQRKSDLKGTKYFNNEFAIANCHLVIVDVAFRNATMEDILKYVDTATEGNFELIELRDHFVKFIAHYEPEYYTADDILNYLNDVFGNETYSIVYITYL